MGDALLRDSFVLFHYSFVPVNFTFCSPHIALDNWPSYHLQLIMAETTAIIAAFAIGGLGQSILLRRDKPVQRQRPRGRTNNRLVQLRRPASTPVSPWVGPASASAVAETKEMQRLWATLAAASKRCGETRAEQDKAGKAKAAR